MTENKTSPLQVRSRDPVLLTWYRFIRVLRKIITLMDEPMQNLPVSRAQFDLLMQVAFEEGVNQQTCAERMNVTKGNIAQHINRLEEEGYVQRQKRGRTNYLFLTGTGEDLVATIMPLHDQRVREILSVLSPEEFQEFQSVLRVLDRKIS